MVCIEKRPHITCGRSLALHFRYLTCLLDRGHITATALFLKHKDGWRSLTSLCFGNASLLFNLLSGNIVQPLPAAVAPDDPGPLGELVGTQKEIHPHHRKTQHEGGQKAQRHRVHPHVDHIADQAEAGIPACPEHAGDQGGFDGFSHNVIGVDQMHLF